MIICNKCQSKVITILEDHNIINKCVKCKEQYTSDQLKTLVYRSVKEQ